MIDYMRAEDGKKLLFTVMDQLIEGLEIDTKTNHVKSVTINTDGIVIVFDE